MYIDPKNLKEKLRNKSKTPSNVTIIYTLFPFQSTEGGGYRIH